MTRFRTSVHLAVRKIVDFASSIPALVMAVAFIVGWAVYAAPKHFDADSQMPVNTTTTIVTFIMGFLILIATKFESRALHLKLDELIRATDKARNAVARIEKQSDEVLDELEKEEIAEPSPEADSK